MATRQVLCRKLGREADGVHRAPYPGSLGRYIYEHISAEAWQAWLKQQTILINEHRLEVSLPQARLFLEEEMKKFLDYSEDLSDAP